MFLPSSCMILRCLTFLIRLCTLHASCSVMLDVLAAPCGAGSVPAGRARGVFISSHEMALRLVSVVGFISLILFPL